MPVQWSTLTSDERWATMSPKRRRASRQAYYDKVVKPVISEYTQFSEIEKDFFDRTEADMGEEDSIGTPLRRGIKSALDYMIANFYRTAGGLASMRKRQPGPVGELPSEEMMRNLYRGDLEKPLTEPDLSNKRAIWSIVSNQPFDPYEHTAMSTENLTETMLKPKPPTGKYAEDLTLKSLLDPKRFYMTLAEGGPTTLALMVATAMNPPIGTSIMLSGEMGQSFKELDEMEKRTGQRIDPFLKGITAISEGAAIAGLEATGITKMLNPLKMKTVKKALAKGGVGFLWEVNTEGVQGVVGAVPNDIYDTFQDYGLEDYANAYWENYKNAIPVAMFGSGFSTGLGVKQAHGNLENVSAEPAPFTSEKSKVEGELPPIDRQERAKVVFDELGYDEDARTAFITEHTGKASLDELTRDDLDTVAQKLKEAHKPPAVVEEPAKEPAPELKPTKPEVAEEVPTETPAKKLVKPEVEEPAPTETVKPEEPTVEKPAGEVPAPVAEESKAKIAEAVKNVETEPSEAQKEAGNYKKGHVNIDGFDISIENPAGSTRSGVSAEGKKWTTKMKAHYGYFKQSEGADGDQVDVFINRVTPVSKKFFVVNQIDPETRKFDEHKVMMGYKTEAQARKGYLANYDKGWQGLGSIDVMTAEEFKTWLKSDKPKKGLKAIAKKPSVGEAKGISRVNVADLTTEKEFQGRETAFSQESVDKIIREGWKEGKDPLVIWVNPKTGKFTIIAGHSRFEAAKKLGIKDVNASIFSGSRKEAITEARLSNRQSTLETLKESVILYNDLKKMGKDSHDELLEAFKTKAEINRIKDFSGLNTEGQFIELLNQKNIDRSDFPFLERTARTIGKLRQKYSVLTDLHEQQLFNFMYVGTETKSPQSLIKQDIERLIQNNLEDDNFNKDRALVLTKQLAERRRYGAGAQNTQQLRSEIAEIDDMLAKVKADKIKLSAQAMSDLIDRKNNLIKAIIDIDKSQSKLDLFKESGTKSLFTKPTPSTQAAAKVSPPLKLEREPTPKRMSIRQIRNDIIKDFGVPLRVGKFRQRAQGIFKVKEEVIRTRGYADLPVLAHEIAHFINKKWNMKALYARSRELAGLDYNPKQRRTSEGFAEYVRHWATGSADPSVIAPKFTAKFNEFLNNTPDLKQILTRLRDNITVWREQGAAERMYSQVDFTGKQAQESFGVRIKRMVLEIRRRLEDDLIFLDWFERQVRGVKSISQDARMTSPAVSPTAMARHMSQTAESRAAMMVLEGTFDFAGKKVYKSLKDVLKPVADDVKNFITYAIARRAIELHGRGIQPGVDWGDAEYYIAKFESDKFKQAFNELKEFQNRVFQLAVDAGVLSEEQAKVIRSLNNEYIPLKRSFERGEIAEAFGGVGKGLIPAGTPFKRIKGSGRTIVNPLQSVIQNTAQIISVADKTMVGKAIIELAEQSEGAGKWVEKIPTPVAPVKLTLQSMKKSLRDVGIEITDDVDLEQVLTFFTNARMYKGRSNIVSFWRDGKQELYEIDPDLYKTLKAVDKTYLHPVLDFIFGKPARLVRAGATGFRAGFSLITNPLRDSQEAALQTEYARGMKMPFKAARSMLQRIADRPSDEMVQMYKRSGVEMSHFIGMDRHSLQNAVDDVLGSPAKMHEFNVVEHPIQALSIIMRSVHFHARRILEGYKNVISVTEAGPRLAEFEAAYKELEKIHGKDSIGAFIGASNAAADITINFKRAGTWGRTLNQIIPFFNSVVQSPFRFGRYVKAHPVKAGLKGLTGLMLPTLTLWWMHKDDEWYKEMPNWLKYGFWHFPIGGTNDKPKLIVRIPRPFVWSTVFSAGPEMIWNYWYNENPEELKKGMGYLVSETTPPVMPQSIKVPIELWANYDFFRDRNIDPYWEVKTKDPADRYSPYTTETMKYLGKQSGLSPRKLEHAMGSSTGGAGMDLVRLAEGSVSKIKQPADYPVIGRLFVRQRTEEERKKKILYERKEEIRKIKRLRKNNKQDEVAKVAERWNRKYPDFKIFIDRG